MIGVLAPINEMLLSVKDAEGEVTGEGKDGTLKGHRGWGMGKVANVMSHPWRGGRHLEDIPVPSIRRQCHMGGMKLLCAQVVASGVAQGWGVCMAKVRAQGREGEPGDIASPQAWGHS